MLQDSLFDPTSITVKTLLFIKPLSFLKVAQKSKWHAEHTSYPLPGLSHSEPQAQTSCSKNSTSHRLSPPYSRTSLAYHILKDYQASVPSHLQSFLQTARSLWHMMHSTWQWPAGQSSVTTDIHWWDISTSNQISYYSLCHPKTFISSVHDFFWPLGFKLY